MELGLLDFLLELGSLDVFVGLGSLDVFVGLGSLDFFVGLIILKVSDCQLLDTITGIYYLLAYEGVDRAFRRGV